MAAGTPPFSEPESRSQSAPPPPELELDRLLRIPRGAIAAPELRGGKDRATWASEFSGAREEVQGLELRIRETQEQLREAAPQDWSFSPTGGGAPSDPEVLKLRALLRRDRQSLQAALKRLQELEVEASLAGAPASWREPPEVP